MNGIKNLTFDLGGVVLKRLLKIVILALVPICLQAQTFLLSLNKESGVYEKGERALITCHMDSLTSDSLTEDLRKKENMKMKKQWAGSV